MARTKAAMPIGTLTKKIQCQEAYSMRRPPRVGPTAPARAPNAPHRPTAMPCLWRGNAASRIASETGVIAAPPTP